MNRTTVVNGSGTSRAVPIVPQRVAYPPPAPTPSGYIVEKASEAERPEKA